MAITRLGLAGGPRGQYGSFAGKRQVAAITRLGLSATPRALYGTFEGKTQIVPITRLGLSGTPRSQYATFRGKELQPAPTVVITPEESRGGGYAPTSSRRKVKNIRAQILREDEEILALIAAAVHEGLIP